MSKQKEQTDFNYYCVHLCNKNIRGKRRVAITGGRTHEARVFC
jgi:hypothetical protein